MRMRVTGLNAKTSNALALVTAVFMAASIASTTSGIAI